MIAAFALAMTLGTPPAFAGDAVFDRLMSAARSEGVASRPIGARMEFFARQLLGTPYVGFTLDGKAQEERCFVTLEGLDCVTFAETVHALARLAPRAKPSDLVAQVTRTRYRHGKVDGYLSRLHYTSDWFADNAARGTWEDVSAALPGAVRMSNPLGFMSANAARYPALNADPALVPRMREIEERLSALPRWYVPSDKVAEAEKLLKTGDIVALVDVREGLDYAHVGLIVREEGAPHLVHASSGKMRVIFDRPLSAYLGSGHRGFSAVRPRE